MCLRQCPSGWYKIYAGRCAKCSDSCEKCLYNYDLCTTCKKNEVSHFLQSAIIKAIKSNQYEHVEISK